MKEVSYSTKCRNASRCRNSACDPESCASFVPATEGVTLTLLGGWMSIDTAPHDNATWVLVWDGDQIDIAIFGRHPLDVQEEMALCWTDGGRELNPTHWMPLPDPPNPSFQGIPNETTKGE